VAFLVAPAGVQASGAAVGHIIALTPHNVNQSTWSCRHRHRMLAARPHRRAQPRPDGCRARTVMERRMLYWCISFHIMEHSICSSGTLGPSARCTIRAGRRICRGVQSQPGRDRDGTWRVTQITKGSFGASRAMLGCECSPQMMTAGSARVCAFVAIRHLTTRAICGILFHDVEQYSHLLSV